MNRQIHYSLRYICAGTKSRFSCFSTISSDTLCKTKTVSHYFSLLHSSPNSTHLRHLHGRLLRTSLYDNVVLTSKLVLMYSQLNNLCPYSLSVFLHMPSRNIYSWNIVIGEFSRSSNPEKATELFLDMNGSNVRGDVFTFPLVLRACAGSGSVNLGVLVHGLCVKMGFVMNLFVGSALVFMYVTFGRVFEARKVFDGMPDRDSVLWTSMLAGYAQHEEPLLGLSVYRDMVKSGAKLDGAVMVSLLLVCGQLGWLKHGKSVHGWCERRCLVLGLSLGNAFIDMYGKCANLTYSHKVFDRMKEKDVISWSAMILGYGLSGTVDMVLELFDRMGGIVGAKPNGVTFVGVLSACAHSGMVEKARSYFELMKIYGVRAELKHYACMVDCLGKAGLLEEAEKLIEEMPMQPDGAVLGALMSGCRVYGNVEVGERTAKKLIKLEPKRSGYFMLLANIYAEAGQFDDAEKVRDSMKQRNVPKVPALSCI